jgi:hypothetical protein
MSDFGELASRVYELEGRLPPELRGDGPIISGNGEIGSTLTCSPGSWSDTPTLAYAWSGGGTVGPDGTTYEVAAADAGTSITCTVTATNPHGTLAAPPSNAVEIPGAAAMSASASSTRSTSASSSHSSSRSKE